MLASFESFEQTALKPRAVAPIEPADETGDDVDPDCAPTATSTATDQADTDEEREGADASRGEHAGGVPPGSLRCRDGAPEDGRAGRRTLPLVGRRHKTLVFVRRIASVGGAQAQARRALRHMVVQHGSSATFPASVWSQDRPAAAPTTRQDAQSRVAGRPSWRTSVAKMRTVMSGAPTPSSAGSSAGRDQRRCVRASRVPPVQVPRASCGRVPLSPGNSAPAPAACRRSSPSTSSHGVGRRPGRVPARRSPVSYETQPRRCRRDRDPRIGPNDSSDAERGRRQQFDAVQNAALDRSSGSPRHQTRARALLEALGPAPDAEAGSQCNAGRGSGTLRRRRSSLGYASHPSCARP